jgi:tetratricopeptide (TPR) repeat protein
MAVMERLVADRPDYYQALNYIGYSLAEERRDLPRALTLLIKADQLSPDTAHILDSLAWAQFRLGQVDAAWTSIQRAVKLEGGDDAVIWEHYGDIAAAKGRPDESRRAYTKALGIGHDKPETIRAKLEEL